mgnify:CR=1 FL=1
MPLGAMMTRSDLWKKDYGSAATFALHTSTFGAGSLACAAGLATLATLQDRQVAENTAARSQQLFRGLEKIASQNKHIISEIRGQGLMIGIELKPFEPLIAAHWSSSDKSGATQYLMPQWQDTIDALPTIYLMNTLLDQHGIYTQVARSNPRVLRVQPPLVVSQGEVDHFLRSLETTISEMHTCTNLAEAMLTKSHLGIHEAAEEKKVSHPATPASSEESSGLPNQRVHFNPK